MQTLMRNKLSDVMYCQYSGIPKCLQRIWPKDQNHRAQLEEEGWVCEQHKEILVGQSKEDNIETHRKYLAWKAGKGDMLELVKCLAMKLLAGRRRFSIDAVVDYARFKEFFEGYRDEPYRINQNHVAYIARDLRKECPEIGKYIKVRVGRGEEEKTGA